MPNSGQGLKNLPRRIQWDVAFRKYLKALDEEKPVILVGDLNVSHTEIGTNRISLSSAFKFNGLIFILSRSLSSRSSQPED